MLNRRALVIVLTCALAGLAMTARGSAGTSPNLAPQAPNLSGQYAGTVHDSLWDGSYGSGQINAALVQYHDAVAGNIGFTFGSSQFGGGAAFVLKETTLTGTGLSANLQLATCPVSVTATYSNGTLTGSYHAVSGCSGDHGTFKMKEYCRYGPNSPAQQHFALKHC